MTVYTENTILKIKGGKRLGKNAEKSPWFKQKH
jgi:hypothetical protein